MGPSGESGGLMMRMAIVGAAPLVRHGLAVQLRERGIQVHGEHARLEELRGHPPADAVLLVLTRAGHRVPPVVPGLSALLARGTAVLLLTDTAAEWVATATALRTRTAPGVRRATHRTAGRVDVLDLDASGGTDEILSWLEPIDARPPRPPQPVPAPVGQPLTAAERQVYALLAQGLSNAGIAAALSLSHKTVECHISNLFGKLGMSATDPARNRRVAAALAWLDRQE